MPYRRSGNKPPVQPPRKRQLPAQPPVTTSTGPGPIPRSARLTISRVLDARTHALKVFAEPTTQFVDFWGILKSFDSTKAVLPRLSREKVEKTPKSFWDIFLGRYIAACVTDAANRAGVLPSLEHAGLIEFPEGPGKVPRGKMSAGFPNVLPALEPLEDEIPFFDSGFLWALQERLGEELKAADLLPEGGGAELEPEERLRKAIKLLPTMSLFELVRETAGRHIRQVPVEGNAPRIVALPDASMTHLFLWLMILNLPEGIIAGLLNGKPHIRRIAAPRGAGNDFFFPTAEGENQGLSSSETEEE